jgi:exopolysaccharide production protein ExoQ
MNPSSATFLFVVGICGLFFLDRDRSLRISKAVWLPVIWLGIASSRPISVWLGIGVPTREALGQLPESSSLDDIVAATLMLLGAIVLIRRRRDVTSVLKASWPIVLYFSFALLSLVWSDFPAWGFKRWVRALGDLIMVLIVATEAQPAAALRRLFSRLGFVLLPVSVLFIKYYPQLGMGWDAWGHPENNGVTTSKNVLGVVTSVLMLGALWQALSPLRDKKQPHRARRLLAQGTLLCFGISLLYTAHCATAVGSFVLGAGLMLALALPLFKARPAAVHTLVLGILLAGGLAALLGGEAEAAKALGRDPDLTGRTEIWEILIPMAPNPFGGAGFETFWLGDRAARAASAVGGLIAINESHNGYIEMYLNLGSIGVGLIALILGQGYRRAVSAFRHDSALGALLVTYVVASAVYSISEAGFRMLGVQWFILLLAIVAASRISLGETASEAGRELADQTVPLGNSDVLELNPTWMNSGIS